jgi:hypothetical protein
MTKRILLFLIIPLLSLTACGETVVKRSNNTNTRGHMMNDNGKCLGRRKMDGSGRFRDGSGPNPNCPRKKENQDSNSEKERENTGRTLKRDGTGPNKDGKGPRDSDLGPKKNCPVK